MTILRRTGLLSLLALSSLLTSLAVYAASIKDDQAMEEQAYMLTTRYFMYTVTERSPDQQEKLNKLIDSMQSLVGSGSNTALAAAWTDYRTALQVDPYDQQDMVVEDKLLDVLDKRRKLVSILHADIGTQHIGNADAGLLFEQSLLMERLTSEYLRRATDPMGGVVVASTGSNQDDPQQMALQFSSNMNKLLKDFAGQKAIYDDLISADRFWNFIRGRMLDFNTNSVPYVISIFNDKITSHLQDAYHLAVH